MMSVQNEKDGQQLEFKWPAGGLSSFLSLTLTIRMFSQFDSTHSAYLAVSPGREERAKWCH